MYRAHLNGSMSTLQLPKHVLCHACGKIQYDSKALMEHCRKQHVHCFICGLNNINSVLSSVRLALVLCFGSRASSPQCSEALSLRYLPSLCGRYHDGPDQSPVGGTPNEQSPSQANRSALGSSSTSRTDRDGRSILCGSVRWEGRRGLSGTPHFGEFKKESKAEAKRQAEIHTEFSDEFVACPLCPAFLHADRYSLLLWLQSLLGSAAEAKSDDSEYVRRSKFRYGAKWPDFFLREDFWLPGAFRSRAKGSAGALQSGFRAVHCRNRMRHSL